MSAAIIALVRRYGVSSGFDNATDYPDETVAAWVADALIDVPYSKLGTKADRAAAYYTCSLMFQASAGVGGSGGGVKKEKTRNVEIEYQQATGAINATDKYYNLYLRLIGPGCKAGPLVLNRRP